MGLLVQGGEGRGEAGAEKQGEGAATFSHFRRGASRMVMGNRSFDHVTTLAGGRQAGCW